MRSLLLWVLFLSFGSANAYWQQQVDYQIEVQLDDSSHFLSGWEELIYHNNSPDTLRIIYFHLWPNAYQKGSPLYDQLLEQGNVLLHFDSRNEGYIDSLDFKVNGERINWSYFDPSKEIALLTLGSPLSPGDSMIVSTPFRIKLPNGNISRLGHVEQAYQITQWYPKPAVYDQKGWHPMPYLNQGEFYSEFGSFRVTIELPQNYMLAATGTLVGESKLVGQELLYQRAAMTQEIRRSGIVPDGILTTPPSSEKTRRVTYFADRVHDFAWFANKRWLLDLDSLSLKPSFRTVHLQSFFLPENKHQWKAGINYLKKGVDFYSRAVGEYPYPLCTAVDGSIAAGGGMEYPMITIIGEAPNELILEETIVHEVGHNWFYGILGNNEREYPWMDEGINSFYERKYLKEEHSDLTLSTMVGFQLEVILGKQAPPLSMYYYYAYGYLASRGLDLPGNLPAQDFDTENYGAIIYAKTAFLLAYLEDYLGEEVFLNGVKNYFKNWAFKHPGPEDFRGEIERVARRDLSWFFDDLLATHLKLDFELGSAEADEDSLRVILRNKTPIPAPVKLGCFRNDSLVATLWVEGFKDEVLVVIADDGYDKVVIDPEFLLPFVHRNRNSSEVNRWWSRMKEIQPHFLADFPSYDKHQMFYLPLLGYNANDGFQVGVMLYNSLLEQKRLRYLMMPQYGWGSNQLVGSYQVIYSHYPKHKSLARINFGASYRKVGLMSDGQVGFFRKAEPKIQWIFKPKRTLKQDLTLRYTATQIGLRGDRRRLTNEYLTLEYQVKQQKVIHPFGLGFNAQWINYLGVKLWGEYRHEITLSEQLKGLEIRLFGGVFLRRDGDLTLRFRLSGDNGSGELISSGGSLVNRGNSDYLMDDIYLARSRSATHFLSPGLYSRRGVPNGVVFGS